MGRVGLLTLEWLSMVLICRARDLCRVLADGSSEFAAVSGTGRAAGTCVGCDVLGVLVDDSGDQKNIMHIGSVNKLKFAIGLKLDDVQDCLRRLSKGKKCNGSSNSGIGGVIGLIQETGCLQWDIEVIAAMRVTNGKLEMKEQVLYAKNILPPSFLILLCCSSSPF
ncbi:hypothetical protein R6Q57_011500 [Mikania cordata]